MNEVFARSSDVTLLEILDRVLDKGVVIAGDIVISVADVDLVYLGLRLLLSSVETMEQIRGGQSEGPGPELLMRNCPERFSNARGLPKI